MQRKMDREEKKRIIHEKVLGKPLLKGIVWLQKEYKIGFSLASEIYFEHNLNYVKRYFEKGNRYLSINYNALESGIYGLEDFIKELKVKLVEKMERYPDNKIEWYEEYQIGITNFVIKVLESGIKMLKPDIYKSDACNIVVDYKKKTLLMPLYIRGVSRKTAESIVLERTKAPFRSLEDLRRRCNIGTCGIDTIDKYSIFVQQ